MSFELDAIRNNKNEILAILFKKIELKLTLSFK